MQKSSSTTTPVVIDLSTRKAAYDAARNMVARRIIVCAGTGCLANGSKAVFEALKDSAEAAGLTVEVSLDIESALKRDLLISGSGCQGF